VNQQKNTTSGDRTQYAAYATYAMGGVTVGYQETRDNMQNTGGGAASYYDNEAFGISFSVNDNLSVSYGSHTSTKHVNKSSSVELEAESVQIAYSMGGASIRLAETSADNVNYTSATVNDRDGTTLSLSLAF